MNRYHYIALTTILLFATLLRFYGLTWGTHPNTGAFHRFHPDETTVVNAAGDFALHGKRANIPYGKIPVYTLGISARIVSAITGHPVFNTSNNQSTRFTHITARSISALLSTLTVWIVFAIGKRLGGYWVGLGSALLIAFSPTHIQQSHFYTVDTTFTFWASLALLLMLRLPSDRLHLYAICGAACGLAAGTRLIGILLAIPFITMHFIQTSDGSPLFQRVRGDFLPLFKKRLKEIYRPIPICLATLTAALFTILGEPDLLFNWQNVTTSRDIFLFSGAVKVARGDMIQIWTLYDYTTWPYLHYITHHLPHAMGLPAALAGFIGLALALWYRPVPALILTTWIIPYFFMVGGLHAKPIRYALPLLPPLAILGSWACHTLGKKIQRPSWFFVLPLTLIGLPTAIFGIAQMRIYTASDGRFAAASWIAQNIPKNDAILVERGGFPTDWMAPANQYNTRPMQGAYFIDAEGFLPYWGQVNFIQSRLDGMRWIVLIKENRLQQYLAVPDRYPIAHAFYQRLENGILGFDEVATFKTRPGIGSWNRSESQTDPTATAFDHPHITIYRSKDKTTVQNHLLQWAEDVSRSPKFPDALIKKGVDAYRAQSFPTASYNFEQAVQKHPNFVLGYIMLGAALEKQGHHAESLQILQKAQAIHSGVSLEAGSGLVLMGMKEEGARFIENMLPIARQTGRKDLDRFTNIAAKAWFDVGVEYQQAQQHENARIALLRSARIDPNFPPLYIHLAEIAETIGNRDAAIMSYQKFLELNPNNPAIQSKLKTLQNQ